MLIETVSFHAAFLAGLLSFFSPCVLPLIPAYFTFITGVSLDQLTQGRTADVRRKVLLSTLLFVIGFSLVFILLGASATFLGRLMSQYANIVTFIGGLLIMVLGIHISGIFGFSMLNVDRHINLKKRPVHALGALVIGMAFGAGWSPCVGPLLGSILIVASSRDTVREGVLLLSVYSAGLAIPFLVLSFFINRLLVLMKKASPVLAFINKVAGALLVVMGIYLSVTALMNHFF